MFKGDMLFEIFLLTKRSGGFNGVTNYSILLLKAIYRIHNKCFRNKKNKTSW